MTEAPPKTYNQLIELVGGPFCGYAISHNEAGFPVGLWRVAVDRAHGGDTYERVVGEVFSYKRIKGVMYLTEQGALGRSARYELTAGATGATLWRHVAEPVE